MSLPGHGRVGRAYAQHYSVTSFSAASLSADLGLVRLSVSSEKIHLVRI